MSKKQRNTQHTEPSPPAAKGVDTLGLATLAATIAVLVISFSNLRSIDRLASDVGQLEREMGRVAQAPVQPQQQPPAQDPPRRRGPDPEQVYEIKTANAPARGPAQAPVVIAEFSDFQ